MAEEGARELKFDIASLEAYLAEIFPQGLELYHTEELGPMSARVRLVYDDRQLRPGGTISGPAMMGLADCAFYYALLAQIGKVPLAVTTNLNINFLRKPGPTNLIADARILKLGRLLATGDVMLFSDGVPQPIAHATMTYAIPPGHHVS